VSAQRRSPDYIGVFDSGVGGLSVLREIHRLVPNIPTLYFADQVHLPYGARPADEIRRFVEAAADFLIQRGAVVIVIACNTASATSLRDLRARYPRIPFVGMEPAVKPAAESTKTGVIGVLSTQITADGDLYRSVQERFAGNVKVITQVAPQLVTMVEDGSIGTPESREIIRVYVQPMMDAGADRIVLACTHFPFLADELRAVAGVPLIDPSEAVARQTARVLPENLQIVGEGLRPSPTPNIYYTSGDPEFFRVMLKRLIGVEAARIEGVRWEDGKPQLLEVQP
jgi:glutamate racemase